MDADDWDERYRETSLLWTAGPNQWVEQHTAHLPAGQALDLACGEGRNALWLAERGWQVTAVDFSTVGVEKGRELAHKRGDEIAERVRWVVGDVLTYQADRSYDLVLLVYLHVPPDQRRVVMRRAAAALAPGGVLLVVGHHSDNLTDGVGGPPYPELLYSEHDLIADLSSNPALSVRAAGRRERSVPDASRPALDVVVEFHLGPEDRPID